MLFVLDEHKKVRPRISTLLDRDAAATTKIKNSANAQRRIRFSKSGRWSTPSISVKAASTPAKKKFRMKFLTQERNENFVDEVSFRLKEHVLKIQQSNRH